jgi:hypothetical protein
LLTGSVNELFCFAGGNRNARNSTWEWLLDI